VKDRHWERYSRKKRQWGLHGHDRISWIVNQAFRNIVDHYYYRRWDYYPDAEKKWEAHYLKRDEKRRFV